MAKPNPDELGPPNLKIDGLQLWVHGYQFPDSNDSDDGNWLRVTAHCGHLGASVWASGAIIQVTDLARWAKQCDGLVRGKGDTAELSPLEPELAVKIVRTDSLGHLEMTVSITPNHLNQEHTFRFEIDQSYVPSIASACRAIEKQYPVRGRWRLGV